MPSQTWALSEPRTVTVRLSLALPPGSTENVPPVTSDEPMAQMGALPVPCSANGSGLPTGGKNFKGLSPCKLEIMTYGHGERKTKGSAGELDLVGHFGGAIQESDAARDTDGF